MDIGSIRGAAIRGSIEKVVLEKGIVYVKLPLTQSDTLQPVKIPAGWVGPKGQISAGYPQKGTPIFVILGQGNEWIFVAYDQPDGTSTYDSDGTRRVNPISKFRPGRWLTLVENDIGLIVDPSYGVIEGSSTHYTQSDPNLGIWSTRFPQEMHFSEAHREVSGPVLRDLDANGTRNVTTSALSGHQYNTSLRSVGLDPKTTASAFSNPALTESRSMFYEFLDSYGYTNDKEENDLFAGSDLSKTKPLQRKSLRTDTMSLSLDNCNYLAEIVIGTVVDIYGNILDINRYVLPSGIVDSLNFKKSQNDKDLVFRKLREQLRKSIAYHFEINARKEHPLSVTDPRTDPSLYTPDYNNLDDYARNRSRFSLDVDKEGQFKLNVPASSEVGNIGLLVRHENFSNLKGAEEEKDRGQFIRNVTDNMDVKLEPHGKGVISLTSNAENLKSYAAPNSRIDGKPIKLGTGFHDITANLSLFKFTKPYSQSGTHGYDDSLLNFVDPITDVVSPSITVSGKGANAGGRSGTISLDGMLSMSIGANTADRQSLWLDCAGGIVTSIGRDRWNRSISANLDGDVLLEVGGTGITDDSRFTTKDFNNAQRDGVIDIRIHNAGSFHTIRIDSQGIKIHTPQRIDIVSEGEMRFKSVRSNMYFDAESIFFYAKKPATGRLVLRSTEGAAGRTI